MGVNPQGIGPCGSLHGSVALAYLPLFPNLASALSRIRFRRQLIQEREELLRLTAEESHVGQELDHTCRNSVGLGRPNY